MVELFYVLSDFVNQGIGNLKFWYLTRTLLYLLNSIHEIGTPHNLTLEPSNNNAPFSSCSMNEMINFVNLPVRNRI